MSEYSDRISIDARPIGIFDSGLGGLTVANEIHRILPAESLLYFGDSFRCPYGPRNTREVEGFVLEICEWLCQKQVKMIVIACNTASAAGLKAAQKCFDVPIIGVVEPGARAAVRSTRTRKIGILATEGTVNSGAYEAAIHSKDVGVKVFSVAAPLLVDAAESIMSSVTKENADAFNVVNSDQLVINLARGYITPLVEEGVDTIVLGCTHIPILLQAIMHACPDNIKLVSSAKETAADVRKTLESACLLNSGYSSTLSFYTSSQNLLTFSDAAGLLMSECEFTVGYQRFD